MQNQVCKFMMTRKETFGVVGKAETDKFPPLARSALFLQRARHIPFQVICVSFLVRTMAGKKGTHVKYILFVIPLAINIVAKEGEEDRAHHTRVA